MEKKHNLINWKKNKENPINPIHFPLVVYYQVWQLRVLAIVSILPVVPAFNKPHKITSTIWNVNFQTRTWTLNDKKKKKEYCTAINYSFSTLFSFFFFSFFFEEWIIIIIILHSIGKNLTTQIIWTMNFQFTVCT